MTHFPIYLHCKNYTLRQRHICRHDVVKVYEFYNRGLFESSSVGSCKPHEPGLMGCTLKLGGFDHITLSLFQRCSQSL